MKIIYCIGSLAKAGGAERVLINKANYLVEKLGYDITILIANQNNQPICYPISKNIKIIDVDINRRNSLASRIPIIGFFYNIKKLKRIYQKLVDEIEPDIIINVERGYEDFIIPSLVPHVPCIRESHSSKAAVEIMDNKSSISFVNLKKRYFTRLYNKQLRKFDKVVLLTAQDVKDRKLSNGNIFIPNIISKFDVLPEYSLDNKKVISVGRLDQYKNFKDQIIVWKDIIQLHPDWTLHIYGDGPEKPSLQELILELRLQNHVYLEGKTKNVQGKLKESSFFIFTSIAEGFGMVIVEAMQMGLPVVSYNCPCGPSDIISDSVDGFLVKNKDQDGLKIAIMKLISNSEKRKKMGEMAIEKSEKYLPEAIMPQWIKLFNQMVNE